MKIFAEESGNFPHTDRSGSIYADDIQIGGWNYDKNQGKLIACVDFNLKRKFFYHDTVSGLTANVQKWIEKQASVSASAEAETRDEIRNQAIDAQKLFHSLPFFKSHGEGK